MSAGLTFNLALGSLWAAALTPMHAHAGVHAGGTGAWIAASGTGQGVHAHPTGIAIYGAGDQWAHNNMPPFLALHFIIRFQ